MNSATGLGLGKIAQAIAACHALWPTGNVRRGLLIVPAALKPQWPREWQAFTDAPATLVDMTRVGATSRVANVRQEVGQRFKGTSRIRRKPRSITMVIFRSCRSHDRGSPLRDRYLSPPRYVEGLVLPPDRYWNGTRTAVKSWFDAPVGIPPKTSIAPYFPKDPRSLGQWQT